MNVVALTWKLDFSFSAYSDKYYCTRVTRWRAAPSHVQTFFSRKKQKLRLWKAMARSACGSPLLFLHFGKQWLIQITSWTFVGRLQGKIIPYSVGSFYVEKRLKYVCAVVNAEGILVWETVESWKEKSLFVIVFKQLWRLYKITTPPLSPQFVYTSLWNSYWHPERQNWSLCDTSECLFFFLINSSWV